MSEREKLRRKLALKLCKAHDANASEREHGAEISYRAGSFSVPYWDALADAAIKLLSKE